MRRLAAILAALLGALGCTTRYQVRGIEQIYTKPMSRDDFVGEDAAHKARQITLEHQAVEYFDEFTVGVPSSPFFSVFADADVIPAHSDIFNSRFVSFLAAFIDAYDERVEEYGPKDKTVEPPPG